MSLPYFEAIRSCDLARLQSVLDDSPSVVPKGRDLANERRVGVRQERPVRSPYAPPDDESTTRQVAKK